MRRALFLTTVFSVASIISFLQLNLAFAGELDPTDPPAPTMKTLEEIYNRPIWEISDYEFVDHPGNTRFAVSEGEYPLSNVDDLVLDKETGLIWLRNADIADYLNHDALPQDSTSTADGPFTLPEASVYCRRLNISNRMAWRLPTVEELSSLIDKAVLNEGLPVGHPFINIPDTGQPHWTATSAIEDKVRYWWVFVDSGNVGHFAMLNKAYPLCVRGGNGRITVDF